MSFQAVQWNTLTYNYILINNYTGCQDEGQEYKDEGWEPMDSRLCTSITKQKHDHILQQRTLS